MAKHLKITSFDEKGRGFGEDLSVPFTFPGDIVEEAIQLAYNIQAKADAADPELAKKQLFDAFSKQGVTVTMLKEHLGHDGTALNPKEMADLRSIFNAIKDGETTWREVVGKEDPKDPDDDKKPDNKKLEGDD